MNLPNNDRRADPRVKLAVKVHLPTQTLGDLEIEVLNLSQGGLSFKTAKTLPLSRKYEIDLFISNEKPISATTRLLWCKPLNGDTIYGAYFVQMDTESQKRILDFLERYVNDRECVPVKDRRQLNRRAATSSTILPSVGNRKVDRRLSARLKERENLAARFLPKEVKLLFHRRVVITGLGVISPIGSTKAAFAKALQEGTSGIRPITRFPVEEFPCRLGGEIPDFAPQSVISAKRAGRMDRATQMAVVASILAMQDSHFHGTELNRRRTGVAMGTTMGGLGWAFDQHEIYGKNGFLKMHPYTVAAASPNACSGEVAAELKANGGCVTYSQGCTSAASAIAYGYDQVRAGYADVMVAGGCEAPFLPSIYGAFCQSGLMAKTDGEKTGLPRPFARNRTGILLAEGAAVIVLEELEHALARNAVIYAELIGVSNTCDGFEMVQPSAAGSEPARAITLALEHAEIDASKVDIVFTHAPGSRPGDSVELKAMYRIFRDRLKKVYVANLKSLIGYMQGATSAVECVAACLALENQFVPPVLNTEHPELALNIAHQARQARLDIALLNCFGFGGKNICLVLRKFQ